jgi:hypothetical protein
VNRILSDTIVLFRLMFHIPNRARDFVFAEPRAGCYFAEPRALASDKRDGTIGENPDGIERIL